eukprot:TRINITY_DN2229_c0_g1_i1.p1 TRINITY_DN2229_c0_g1~~TRINITY_DN2229_c0_g1_i1.p1  ORF type:complete len:165 (-),score=46.19 TRINITY_DN2229_c0_g1_i1:407-901(-)
MINALLAQSMQRAQYIVVEDTEPTEWKHWALNFPLYTHFTSPIRRYADVMVHRLLMHTEIADDEEKKVSLPPLHQMKAQCRVCNERNTAAHFAEIESQSIHLCLVLIDRPVVVDAMLIDLLATVFILVIPGLGIDVRVVMKMLLKNLKVKLYRLRKSLNYQIQC